MHEANGFDPRVGEIRAVRTFRVGPGGVLFPLFSGRPWVDGDNVAACRVVEGAGAHAPPEPDCTCGFYAYAELAGAAEYPHARYVLAVVACWGRVIVGTKGLRAQHARIDAIWLSDVVSGDLVGMVAEQYPRVAIYSDRTAMLSAHVPTVLDDYEADQSATHVRRIIARLLTGAALVAGLVPTDWIGRVPYGWVCWTAVLAILLCVGVARPGKRPDAVAQRRKLLSVALAMWMAAPLAGTLGVLVLRLPLVQIAVLLLVHKVAMDRAARTFPAHIG